MQDRDLLEAIEFVTARLIQTTSGREKLKAWRVKHQDSFVLLDCYRSALLQIRFSGSSDMRRFVSQELKGLDVKLKNLGRRFRFDPTKQDPYNPTHRVGWIQPIDQVYVHDFIEGIGMES